MKEKLKLALKDALKAQEKVKIETIRLCLAAFQYEEMQKGVELLDDVASIELLKREVKKRKEELEYAEQAKRSEQITKLNSELAAIEGFLPKQLSEAEIEATLAGFKTSNTGLNMGGAMKLLKDGFSGQYDGKLASEVAKRVFG